MTESLRQRFARWRMEELLLKYPGLRLGLASYTYVNLAGTLFFCAEGPSKDSGFLPQARRWQPMLGLSHAFAVSAIGFAVDHLLCGTLYYSLSIWLLVFRKTCHLTFQPVRSWHTGSSSGSCFALCYHRNGYCA